MTSKDNYVNGIIGKELVKRFVFSFLFSLTIAVFQKYDLPFVVVISIFSAFAIFGQFVLFFLRIDKAEEDWKYGNY